MKTRYKILLAACAAAFAGGAQAAAYKCQDEKGRTVYSDIPCAAKIPAAPKPAAVSAKPVAEAVPLTRLTEADVLRTLTLSEEYTRTNNHVEACNIMGADMKIRADVQIAKPPRMIEGGREEACKLVRENAEQSKRSSVISLIERGPTKVSIEPGEQRAIATYDAVVKFTRYDRIVGGYRCSTKDQFALVGGKALFTSSESVCKP